MSSGNNKHLTNQEISKKKEKKRHFIIKSTFQKLSKFLIKVNPTFPFPKMGLHFHKEITKKNYKERKISKQKHTLIPVSN